MGEGGPDRVRGRLFGAVLPRRGQARDVGRRLPLTRPLTFGFGVFPYTRFRDLDDLVRTVELGEQLGYDAVHLPEHLLPPAWPDAPAHTKVWHDQVALASFLAARTSRLLLQTSVLVVPYHPPVQLAKALATLDLLSHGRVRLGVGVGWMRAEFRRLGIPFEERGAITDEYLRALRELWTAERPSFSGRYLSFDDVSFLPRPGHIPIYVGGTGPRPFRRVAELGDGWLPMTAGPAELAAGRAEIERLYEERGRDPATLWIGASFRAGGDPETERMVAHVAGTEPAEPTGRRSAGECTERIEELRAAGASHVSVAFAWRDGAELREELARFAAEVAPALRARWSLSRRGARPGAAR